MTEALRSGAAALYGAAWELGAGRMLAGSWAKGAWPRAS